MTEITDHTVVLLKYHENHPEVSKRHLGELFGITKQRVGHIIKRYKRDRMAVEYFRTHPEVHPAEISKILHISEERIRRLMLSNFPIPPSIPSFLKEKGKILNN